MLNYSSILFLLLALLYTLVPASESQARTNSFSASISIREGYDSNPERALEHQEEDLTTTVSPSFDFTSQGRRDNISISYAPGLQYSEDEDNSGRSHSSYADEHHLLIGVERTFWQNFQLSLSEAFILTNDPYLQEYYSETPGERGIVSEDVEQRTFWTNAATVSLGWNYSQGSNLTLSYANHVYEQEDDAFEGDYERHNPSINLEQRLSPKWSTTISYGHSKAKFEEASAQETDDPNIPEAGRPADIENNDAAFGIYFTPTQHTAFLINGSYGNNKFEEALGEDPENDYEVYNGQIGWRQTLGHSIGFELSAGQSTVDWDTDSRPNEDAFSYEGEITKTMDRGSISFGGRGGFEDLYYNGTNDGLSRFWLLETALDYQLQQQLTVNLSGSYRNDTFPSRDEEGNDIKEDLVQVGLGFSYDINRWSSLQLRYSFRQSETDEDSNNDESDDKYDVHRLFLEVRISKEIWRW